MTARTVWPLPLRGLRSLLVGCLVLGGLLGSAAHATPPTDQCPEVATLEDFQAAARAGERAFAEIDLPALTRAREVALATIPCLGQPVTPAIAADFHRMMAMAAFTAGDEALVLAEFHAARRLDPGYHIPASVAPPGHPLVELYEAASRHTDTDQVLESVIPPVGGTAVVDGTVSGLRPRGLSAIVQVYREDGLLTQTVYLLPGDPTPRYGPVPVEVEQERRRRRALLAATGGTALIAGGLYTRAVVGEALFMDTSRTLSKPRKAQATNNAYFWSSLGVGTAALGLGVVTTITW